MDYALTPTDGLPRVIRFAEAGELPASVIAHLVASQNLLLINREQYNKLGHLARHMVWRTKEHTLYTHDFNIAA